jgi:hypothetical protein
MRVRYILSDFLSTVQYVICSGRGTAARGLDLDIDRIVRECAGGASTGAESRASARLRESGHGGKGRCEGNSESIMGLSGSLGLGKVV